jgi:hypothetical protein
LRAFDADEEGFSEPRADGRWGWRAERVAELLDEPGDGPLFFAGCSEEQATLPFDYRVLLTAPVVVLLERLRTRTGNRYGQSRAQQEQVLADLAKVEPLLRRSADLVLETTSRPSTSRTCCCGDWPSIEDARRSRLGSTRCSRLGVTGNCRMCAGSG